MSDTPLNLNELRKIGTLQQKQKEYFVLRLHCIAGDLTTSQLETVVRVANNYGRGKIHLTTRQGIEIHFVHQSRIIAAREELEAGGIAMGACGPRVRIIVACPGAETCRWGIIDTKEISRELDKRYFRQDTPYKFKMGVTGCSHNCAKANENDIGLTGSILPSWNSQDCTQCDLCLSVCPTKAIRREGDEYLLDEPKCIHCSICTNMCPTGSWYPVKKGYTITIGGTMGKLPRFGTPLKTLVEDPREALKLVEASLKYYQAHGRKKERFGHLIDRIGLEKVKEEIINGI